jgi:hypothetical protein
LRAVLTVGKRKNPLVWDQENRVGGSSPQHCVWPEISSLPVQNGKGHCRAERTNCPLLEIVASPGKFTSTIFRLPHRGKHYWLSAFQAQILYESHPVCHKNLLSMVLILDVFKRNILVMTLMFIACSLGNIEIPMIHPSCKAIKKLGLSWQVWLKSWHYVSLRCFCSSVRLCGTNFAQIFLFRKSSWRIWPIVSLLMFNLSDIILRANRRPRVTI